MPNPKAILITGSSSGLGLAFLTHYLAHPTVTAIIAIDINPLPSIIHSTKTLTFHQTSITSPTAIQRIAKLYHTTPIDLVIHSAGVRGLVRSAITQQGNDGEAREVRRAETWDVMDQETMLSTFEVNTFGCFNIIQAFLPSLLLSETSSVVVLSSRNGSIASNTTGAAYAYRASKAALNAVVKSFSVDFPGVRWCLLHPGRVETGLVGWKEPGAIGIGEALEDCVKVVEGLETSEGNLWFLDRFGEVIPW